MLINPVDKKMETQNKHTTTSNRQSDLIESEESPMPASSYYYLLFKVICAWINKKDELAEEQRSQLFGMQKEYLGICFLNSLVFPLRSLIKQHEIYYNTGNYINGLKSSSKLYGRVASPEEAFDVLIDQKTIVRDGILVMANNFLSLKQAIDNSLKEQFVRLCNEAQQGMPDILLICGFLRDESLVQIHRNDIISVTDENGKELGDKGLEEISQELCSRRKNIMNIKGELPFLHHYSGKKGEERYPIQKAIVLYKLTLKYYFATLGSYSGSEVFKIDNFQIKDRILFYRIMVPVYLSTMKEAGLDIDAFIQRWEDTYGNDSVWVAEAKKLSKESSDPIIEEPSTVKKGNGTSQCWLKDGIPETGGTMAGKIDDWCRFLNPLLKTFQGYDEKDKNRIKQITRISCSMIYGVLEDIGYANDYASGRYGKSFESTMKKTTYAKDFRRQDMKFYMKMIKAYKDIMHYIKDETTFSRHGSIEPKSEDKTYNKPNNKNILTEILKDFEILSIECKDSFYEQFLLNNILEFFDVYKQLLQQIKREFKIKLETPQYNMNKSTLENIFIKSRNSSLQGADQINRRKQVLAHEDQDGNESIGDGNVVDDDTIFEDIKDILNELGSA